MNSVASLLKERVLSELKGTPDELKTALMMHLENAWRMDISNLIMPQEGMSTADIADRLSYPGRTISKSTIIKWRQRLGIRNIQTVKPGPKANGTSHLSKV